MNDISQVIVVLLYGRDKEDIHSPSIAPPPVWRRTIFDCLFAVLARSLGVRNSGHT